MADVLANPVVIGLLVGLPSFFLGYLGYRRSQKADQATASTDAIGQIIDGLNKLIDNLQDDNRAVRERADALQSRLNEAATQLDRLKRTIATLSGGIGIVLLLALLVGTQATEPELVERAVQAGRSAAQAEAKQEVKEQVHNEISGEVTEQLDDRLAPTTATPPPDANPFDLVPATTTTAPGPFDLTTTTTTAPEPPPEPPPTTTTTEVPIVTLPTLPPLPEVPLP